MPIQPSDPSVRPTPRTININFIKPPRGREPRAAILHSHWHFGCQWLCQRSQWTALTSLCIMIPVTHRFKGDGASCQCIAFPSFIFYVRHQHWSVQTRPTKRNALKSAKVDHECECLSFIPLHYITALRFRLNRKSFDFRTTCVRFQNFTTTCVCFCFDRVAVSLKGDFCEASIFWEKRKGSTITQGTSPSQNRGKQFLILETFWAKFHHKGPVKICRLPRPGLGKICLKNIFAKLHRSSPPFLVEKSLRPPLIFFWKKSSPVFAPPPIWVEKNLRPLFYFFQKQPKIQFYIKT